MRIETICPRCSKKTHTVKETHAFGRIITFYACGHSIGRKELVDTSANIMQAREQVDPFEFLNSVPRFHDLFLYQRDGVKFGLSANMNFICADEPGLGKTMQALLLLASKYDHFKRVLFVVPAGLTVQWARCFTQWCKINKLDLPFIHINTKRGIIEDEKIHIVSASAIAATPVLESIIKEQFDLLIVDEAHYFKNEDSDRTQALMQIAKTIPHKIFLTGTPLVNRVAEYFPLLHMLRPDHWPNRAFLDNLCDRDEKGKPLGLRADRRDYFFNRTKDYIIRRKKLDVLTDMPPFQRFEVFFSPESNKGFVSVYNSLLDEIEEIMANQTSASTGQILGIIQKILAATGLAKVPLIVDYAIDWLESDETGQRKLAIGVTHLNVMRLIAERLNERGYPTVTMSSEDPLTKDRIQADFRDNKRVLVATIMGCAEGRNMQFCDFAIIAERFWNAAKEEQFEQRFWRYGQKNGVQAPYLMLQKTLDEWLHNMVQMKRGITGSALDFDLSVDGQMLMELARQMTSSRLRVVKG